MQLTYWTTNHCLYANQEQKCKSRVVAGREPVTGAFILLGISFKASLPQSAELTTAQKVTNMLIEEQLLEDREWRQHTHHLTEFLSLNNEYLKQGKNNFPKCHRCAAFNLTHNYSSDQSRQFSWTTSYFRRSIQHRKNLYICNCISFILFSFSCFVLKQKDETRRHKATI